MALGQCQRLLAPAKQPDLDAPMSIIVANQEGATAKEVISEQAKLRAEKRKALDDEFAKRRARHLALEADLAGMIQSDIPAALARRERQASDFQRAARDVASIITRPNHRERGDDDGGREL